MPAKDVVAPNVAAPWVNPLKARRGAELSKQYIPNHLRGRLCPTLVLIHAHILCIVGVHNMVLAIKMRRCYRRQHEGDVVQIRTGGWCHVARHGELIVLAGAGGTASALNTDK